MVSTYGAQIVDELVKGESPETICANIGLCSSSKDGAKTTPTGDSISYSSRGQYLARKAIYQTLAKKGKTIGSDASKKIAEKKNGKKNKAPKPGFMTEEQARQTVFPKKQMEQRNAKKAEGKPTVVKNMPFAMPSRKHPNQN